MSVDPRCPEMYRARRRRVPPPPPRNERQQALPLGKPAKATPEAAIRSHLLGVLPPGVPPNFQAIGNAEFRGKGRTRTAVGTLTMTDGLSATVEVFIWGPQCAGHRWLAWDGPPLFYEDGHWQRDMEAA